VQSRLNIKRYGYINTSESNPRRSRIGDAASDIESHDSDLTELRTNIFQLRICCDSFDKRV